MDAASLQFFKSNPSLHSWFPLVIKNGLKRGVLRASKSIAGGTRMPLREMEINNFSFLPAYIGPSDHY